jgi:hypothetical protein
VTIGRYFSQERMLDLSPYPGFDCKYVCRWAERPEGTFLQGYSYAPHWRHSYLKIYKSRVLSCRKKFRKHCVSFVYWCATNYSKLGNTAPEGHISGFWGYSGSSTTEGICETILGGCHLWRVLLGQGAFL